MMLVSEVTRALHQEEEGLQGTRALHQEEEGLQGTRALHQEEDEDDAGL